MIRCLQISSLFFRTFLVLWESAVIKRFHWFESLLVILFFKKWPCTKTELTLCKITQCLISVGFLLLNVTGMYHIFSFWEEAEGFPKCADNQDTVIVLLLIVRACVHLSLGVHSSFCTALCGRWSVSEKCLGCFHRNRMRVQYHVQDHLWVFTMASSLNLTANYWKRQTPSVTPCFVVPQIVLNNSLTTGKSHWESLINTVPL